MCTLCTSWMQYCRFVVVILTLLLCYVFSVDRNFLCSDRFVINVYANTMNVCTWLLLRMLFSPMPFIHTSHTYKPMWGTKLFFRIWVFFFVATNYLCPPLSAYKPNSLFLYACVCVCVVHFWHDLNSELRSWIPDVKQAVKYKQNVLTF